MTLPRLMLLSKLIKLITYIIRQTKHVIVNPLVIIHVFWQGFLFIIAVRKNTADNNNTKNSCNTSLTLILSRRISF